MVSDNGVQPVTIKQAGIPLIFDVEPGHVPAGWEEDEYTVQVTTNSWSYFSIEPEDYTTDWCWVSYVDRADNIIKIHVDEAESTTQVRTAKFIVRLQFEEDFITREITVTQQPKPVP